MSFQTEAHRLTQEQSSIQADQSDRGRSKNWQMTTFMDTIKASKPSFLTCL
jgi:hypothetical protein